MLDLRRHRSGRSLYRLRWRVGVQACQAAEKLEHFPASTKRVLKADGCAPAKAA